MCGIALRMAAKGRRVYLYAFRILPEYQGKGLGKYLLNSVIQNLSDMGYSEFTVGVEDDNSKAIHIYKSFGFSEIIARKKEKYQGYAYEYNLYLRNH